jgi:hypothetical protein
LNNFLDAMQPPHEEVSSPKETGFELSESAKGEDAAGAISTEGDIAATATNGGGAQASSSQQPRHRKKQFAVSTRWEQEVATRGQPRDVHSFFCCCACRVGNMFILLEYADGSPIVIAGPCWPFCLLVTVPLILGISFLVSFFLVLNKKTGLVSLHNK